VLGLGLGLGLGPEKLGVRDWHYFEGCFAEGDGVQDVAWLQVGGPGDGDGHRGDADEVDGSHQESEEEKHLDDGVWW
jgi:hypothetical protein